jgi:leader peptidase (prepilin peptidase)/N-methyltransferase
VIAVVAGLFGLVIGSFLYDVIHRVPIRQSIVWSTSRCPSCGERIKSSDNLPVHSYLILKGRCRNCKAHISPRYPLVEALTGVLFALAAYEFGLSLSLLWALVLISVLVALAGTDLEHRLLPNAIVVSAAAVGLLLSAVVDPGRWWIYPLSAVAVAAALFALALAYPGGMGDVKMGRILGTFLGRYAALAVFVGALVVAVVGGVLMVTGVIERGSALPFGVFLALAGIFTLFVGQDVREWYLRLVRGA